MREIIFKYRNKKEGNVKANEEMVLKKFGYIFNGSLKEILLVLYVNSKGEIFEYETIATGGSGELSVYVSDIFRGAIFNGADGIILVHNHPAGYLEFSETDLRFMKLLIEQSSLLGITIIDSMVIADNKIISITDSAKKKKEE